MLRVHVRFTFGRAGHSQWRLRGGYRCRGQRHPWTGQSNLYYQARSRLAYVPLPYLDISADGYSRAEGFGAIYLKKLSDAVSQGDPIRAVVRGTSFNANGKMGGISHPSPDGQEAVIRQAYKASGGLNPDLTGYVECHGTGTPVGDPIEVSAVGRVFSPGRKDKPLLIGSVCCVVLSKLLV